MFSEKKSVHKRITTYHSIKNLLKQILKVEPMHGIDLKSMILIEIQYLKTNPLTLIKWSGSASSQYLSGHSGHKFTLPGNSTITDVSTMQYRQTLLTSSKVSNSLMFHRGQPLLRIKFGHEISFPLVLLLRFGFS